MTTLFPSNNAYGIPDLLLSMQATHLQAPLVAWGSRRRDRRMRGTWTFFVDDYRFQGAANRPEQIFHTQCQAITEINFSTDDSMPRALVLGGMYRKRWISRYLQSHLVQIWVDLEVAQQHHDLMLLGVPAGWSAYACRGYGDDLPRMQAAAALAEQRAGGPINLLVYGGAQNVREWANKCHYHYIAEHRTELPAWEAEEEEADRQETGTPIPYQGIHKP